MEPLKLRLNKRMISISPETYMDLLEIQSQETTLDYRPTLRSVVNDLAKERLAKVVLTKAQEWVVHGEKTEDGILII